MLNWIKKFFFTKAEASAPLNLMPVSSEHIPKVATKPVQATKPKNLMNLSKWDLDPKFEPLVQEWLYQCQLKGFDIKITQGRRTQKYQDELYAQGRTKPGKIVTWTRNSKHIKGTAIDYAFKGSIPYPNIDSHYKKIADVGVELGMKAGYYFTKGQDRVHLELP